MAQDHTHAGAAVDLASTPLETLDPSVSTLYETDAHLDLFRRLRRESPVHFLPDSDFGPYWSVCSYEAIREVDTTHGVFSSQDNIVIGEQPPEFHPPMFIAMDPPKHTGQRKAAMPGVDPSRRDQLEPLIRAHAAEILDGLPRNEEFNWVDHVSRELTARMLATLFDVPIEDRYLLTKWSDAAATMDAVGAPTDMAQREADLRECLAYFMDLWAKRAVGEPKSDFITLLAQNPKTRDMHERPMEFLGNLMLLIVGGNDTTRNSISGGLWALNQFPDQYAKLKADPSLIPNMASEMIRWQTPLAHMRRQALTDYELGGKTIRKGDKVVMWYISGNRDEAVWGDGDAFQIDRPNARAHIAFGFGIHRCMGNRIGELQLKVLWEEILKRFDRVEVVGEPLRVTSNFVRGYEVMPAKIAA